MDLLTNQPLVKENFKFLPVAVYLSDIKYYQVNSVLEILKDAKQPFFDNQKSEHYFQKFANEIYLPILEFLLEYQIQANIILTGSFIHQAQLLYPDLIKVLKRLLDTGNINLVVDNYYGAGLTCFYNPLVWADGIIKSFQKVKEVFNVSPDAVYLPQLYRNLELERLTNHGLTNFLIRNYESKAYSFSMHLSDLRRYDGHVVPWIRANNDTKCNFVVISENLFFETNWNIFQPSLHQASKAFSMAAGLASIDFQINLKKGKGRPLSILPRINERYSISRFNSLQQGVIRLWEYASIIVGSQLQNQDISLNNSLVGVDYGNHDLPSKTTPSLTSVNTNRNLKSELDQQFSQDTLDDFLALQNTEFLIYLNHTPFYDQAGLKKELNFTSPYEAFVCMQTAVKQIEILIRNRI